MQEEMDEKMAEDERAEKEAVKHETAENKAFQNEMLEKEIADAESPETKAATAEGGAEEAAVPGNRGAFLKCVAGVYLIYTAYELGSAYLNKEEGSSLGFFVAGIIFGIIGVFLLYIVIRDFLRENRNKKAESAGRMEGQDREP